jgi:diguanylate cyclase (GGDEF)-like protein
VLTEGSSTLHQDPPHQDGAVQDDDHVDPGPGAAEPWLWRSVLAGNGPLLLPRIRGRRRPDTQLGLLGYQEAVVVPIVDESGILGTLMVAERMGQVRTFHRPDITMLETVANQAGLALNNSRLMQRLRHDALHDTLTRLGNRAQFNQALRQALTAIEHGDRPGLAVLLLDLDGFKEVNDSFGHHNGDTLLVHVAQQLTTTTGTIFGESATVARLGGDEFAVLVAGTISTDTAVAVAGLLQQAIAEPIVIDDVEVAVRASIGIALAPIHGRDPALLLQHADEAMYAAKTGGGGTRLHHPDTRANSRTGSRTDPAGKTSLALLADLRHAIERHEIGIHVQPQAHTSTGQVYGAEALVRWDHPPYGLLPPAEFLPLAERHGLMHDLTRSVLDQAVQAAAGWHAAGLDLTISVNLSARSLTDHRLQPAIEAALRRHQLPPSRLTLEITEDCVIDDPDRAVTLLEALRSTGVRLSVDDFGTGYSSLSYLRRLPVNEVKIDRSFVTTLVDDPDNQVIVRAITDLGTNLNLTVIAEGVEDQPTWNHLAGLGCHAIQGYHLAKPMPPEHLHPWLQDRANRRSPETAMPAPRPPRPRLHAI